MPASPATKSAYEPNRVRSIVGAIHINVISAAMLLIQPAFVQALVERLGFDSAAAGNIAGIEMLGVAAGAALAAMLAAHVPWRPASVLAIALMVASTLLSVTPSTGEGLGAARFVAGVGSGWLMSLSFEAVGRTRNPDRNFAWLVTCALLFGAAGVIALPAVLEVFGIAGVFVGLAAYYGSGLLAISSLPAAAQGGTATREGDASTPRIPQVDAWSRRLAVAAMFLYNVAQGAVWSYLALMGTAHGLDGDAVSLSLTASQLAGLAAVLAAGALTTTVTRMRALAIGIVGAGVVLFLLAGPQPALMYGALVCAFNAAWNWTDPYLLGTMAAVDSTGRVMVWAIAWRLLGLAIGPFIAALLVHGDDFSGVNALGVCALLASLACIARPLRALQAAGR
jgi:predicted MFS family arabinose efflux permease